MDTEKLLKWGVIAVLGFFALQWFTGLLNNIVGAGQYTPEPYNVPYQPGGLVVPAYYGVTPWSPDHNRGRGSRWTYGGR